jgi:hypothetical protein
MRARLPERDPAPAQLEFAGARQTARVETEAGMTEDGRWTWWECALPVSLTIWLLFGFGLWELYAWWVTP